MSMTEAEQGSTQAQASTKAGDATGGGDREGLTPGGMSIVDCNFTHPHAHITGPDYFAIIGRPSDGTLSALGEIDSRRKESGTWFEDVCRGDAQELQGNYLGMVYGFR